MQRATLAKVPSQSQCDVPRIALSGPANINREGGCTRSSEIALFRVISCENNCFYTRSSRVEDCASRRASDLGVLPAVGRPPDAKRRPECNHGLKL